MKRCPMCGRELGAEHFTPRSDAPHRLGPYCRDCKNAYQREYRAPSRRHIVLKRDKARQMVQELRARGLSYVEIARAARTDQTNVRKIEAGVPRHVRDRTVDRLAHALIVTGEKR